MKSFGFKQLRRKEGPSFYLKGFQRNKSQIWGVASSCASKSAKAASKSKRKSASQAVEDASDDESKGCYDDDDFDESEYPRASCSSYGESHRLKEIKP